MTIKTEYCKCKPGSEEIFYYLSTNNDGWKCNLCEKELGFRPDLDEEMIGVKVSSILNDLHSEKFIYVSNGSNGADIIYTIVEHCKNNRRFDQYFIIKSIIALDYFDNSDFWKEEANKFFNKDKQIALEAWNIGKSAENAGVQFSQKLRLEDSGSKSASLADGLRRTTNE